MSPLVRFKVVAKDLGDEVERIEAEQLGEETRLQRDLVEHVADGIRQIYPDLPTEGLYHDLSIELGEIVDGIAARQADLLEAIDQIEPVLEDACELAAYTASLVKALGESMGLNAADHEARRRCERIMRALPVGVDPPGGE